LWLLKSQLHLWYSWIILQDNSYSYRCIRKITCNNCFFPNKSGMINSTYTVFEQTAGSNRMMSHDNKYCYVKLRLSCI
jgi:hypothetical protein